jgi:hypothetical protein
MFLHVVTPWGRPETASAVVEVAVDSYRPGGAVKTTRGWSWGHGSQKTLTHVTPEEAGAA